MQPSSAAPNSSTGLSEPWYRDWVNGLALFISCSILLLWLFRSEIGAAVAVWGGSRTFGHDFLIFPITLFLFYRLRHKLMALRPKFAPWAFIPIACALLWWMLGDLANLMVTKQSAFVALWQSLFLLILGWRVTRTAIFPLAYLYLAVPFGSSVIPILQDVTAQIVVHLLRFSGVPVFLEGYHIEIPTGSFLIAEACSGVRYLMVCIALGILAANLFFHSWPRRLLFLGLSIVVPIVANGIRAYGIVILAHFGHYTLAFNIDHVVYGFAFLSVVTLSLLGLGALFRDGHDSLLPDAGHPAVVRLASNAPKIATSGRSIQVFYAGLAMAVIILAQFWTTATKAPPTRLTAALQAPVVASPWALDDGGRSSWSPEFHGMDAELQQGYRRGNEHVDLQVAYYVYQREGAEAISDLNAIAGGRREMQVLSSSRRNVQIGTVSLPVNGLVIHHDGQVYLVWYWYWVGGVNTNSRLAGKLLELKALATGGERAAAVIAVSSEVVENAEGTAALLETFLRQSINSNGTLFQVDASSLHAVTSGREPSSDQTEELSKP